MTNACRAAAIIVLVARYHCTEQRNRRQAKAGIEAKTEVDGQDDNGREIELS